MSLWTRMNRVSARSLSRFKAFESTKRSLKSPLALPLFRALFDHRSTRGLPPKRPENAAQLRTLQLKLQ